MIQHFCFVILNRSQSNLEYLSEAILKYNFKEVGKPHDCLDDATMPVQMICYWLEHDESHVKNLLCAFLQKISKGQDTLEYREL